MTVLSGRYELGTRLGTGGMGEVFEAHDRKLGRRVAVKLLLPTVRDPNARARFVREVEVAAALTHPNLVTVYDVGIWDDGGGGDDRPYFVMEIVDGRTLAARLEEGPLPVDEATRIAKGMLAGLGAAHRRGLVHRDVKPGNVLLGNDGTVKLTDFGIAKAAHDATTALTATGQLVGTPSYLSPEQVVGEAVGPATDVYAAGIVLYEMLAGAPPFRGDSAIATALQHRQAPVPPLADRRPDVPAPVVHVVDRALQKDPTARFVDADTMRVALDEATMEGTQRVVASEPTLPHLTSVLPAPPARTAAAPSPRESRRRRRWVPAAVIGGIIGLAIVAGALALTDSDDSPRGNPAAAAAPETTTSSSTTTTTIPTPRNLAELAAVLAGNPDAYGIRGRELLEGMSEILQGDDEDGDVAQQLYDDLPDWIAAGEIEPEVGSLAQQYLVPYLEGTGDQGDDKGPGKGPKEPKEPKGPKDERGFDLRDLFPQSD